MKKIVYSEIKGDSKGFILFIASTIALVFLALSSAWYMEHNGHHVTGMTNQIVWGIPHVFAIFLVVAASGALNVASIGTVFGKKVYKPLGRLSSLLAIALLIGGLAVLVLDLGHPDRLLIAMTHFNFKSIFAWNVNFYVGFLVVVALYLWAQMDRKMNKYATAIGTFAFLWRLALTTATGSIFGFLVSREAYDSAIMAPLFINMSFSFGLAIFCILIIISSSVTQRELGSVVVNRLGKLLAIFVAGVLYFTLVQHLTNLYAAEHTGIEQFILQDGGIYTLLFWLFQVVLGGLVPIAMLLYPGRTISQTTLLTASSLIIVGGLAQIYVIVVAAQAWPLNLFPGKEVSSSFYDGVINSYTPSNPEIFLGLGGFAIAALITAIGMKILRFLPNSLANSVTDPHHKTTAD